MLGRVLVFCGGKIARSFVEHYLEQESFDTVVCADAGLNHANDLSMPVHYFMGDFDSVAPEVLQRYKAQAEWIQYPAEKDVTDTQIVLEWIVEHGAAEIVMLGATGGRLDHFLANVNLLMLPLKANIPAYIVDEYNRIYLINRETVIHREEIFGKYISLQPLTSQVTEVSLQGFRYLLDHVTLTVGTGRAVSNELAADASQAVISFRDGVLIVLESRDLPC